MKSFFHCFFFSFLAIVSNRTLGSRDTLGILGSVTSPFFLLQASQWSNCTSHNGKQTRCILWKPSPLLKAFLHKPCHTPHHPDPPFAFPFQPPFPGWCDLGESEGSWCRAQACGTVFSNKHSGQMALSQDLTSKKASACSVYKSAKLSLLGVGVRPNLFQ